VRKVVLLEHVSLDGFVGRPNGEMDWITFDEDLANDAAKLTEELDASIFGRVTYQMMQHCWPTAPEQPDATAHDIKHASWLNPVTKYVCSTTLQIPTLPGPTRRLYET
jgi:dihydrofolate reductase